MSESTRFTNGILKLAEEGQELSLGDKLLITKECGMFVNDYMQATGVLPVLQYADVCLMVFRLQAYGYVFPKIDAWFDQCKDEHRVYEEKRQKMLRAGKKHIVGSLYG